MNISLIWLLTVMMIGHCRQCDLYTLPRHYSCAMVDKEFNKKIINPCSIVYLLVDIQQKDRTHFEYLIKHYQNKIFGCAAVIIIFLHGNE
jgi:hypothetical protein